MPYRDRKFAVRNLSRHAVGPPRLVSRDSPIVVSSAYRGKGEVKVKFTLEQAMKAQRKIRGIALLFL